MKKRYILIIALFCLGVGVGKAQYTNLLNFNDVNGQYPFGSLTLSGNVLYGMSQFGGVRNTGCVFSIHTDGTGYKDIYDFTGPNGSQPWGSLILSGSILYGMSQFGGARGYGTIFSIDTNGGQYKQLYNFNDTNGAYPTGALALSGGLLYGVTRYGGKFTYGGGTIFSIDTSGIGFTNLYDFPLNTGESNSKLAISGNVLYCISQGSNDGVLISIHKDGSREKTLYAFNGISGSNGDGSLTLSAAGNVLYGVTWSGGTYNKGVIFSIDTSGLNYKDVYNFNYPIGNFPYYGGLTLSGNKLYGMTVSGGADSMGNVFAIDTNGSHYTDLLDFNGANGATPQGLVTISGPMLYGMTSSGGIHNDGVIFRYDTALNLTTGVTNISCHGANNGVATVYPNGGTAPYTYFWSNGGTGAIDIGLSAGTYTVTLRDIYGATVSSSVTLTQPAILTATHDSLPDTLACNGMAAVQPSGGTPPYAYQWTGGQSTDSIKNQCAGTYCCTITDKSGCSLSTCVTVACTNHYTQSICIAGLDTSTNKYGLIWGRNNSPPAGGYGHYNIYKDTGLGYALLSSQPLDSLSGYIDISSNPSLGSATYEISTVDSCGESALSAPHTTIFLTTIATLNAFHLNWTAYVGFTPTQYLIFRGPGLNALAPIDSVTSNVLTYSDTLPPPGSYYAVEAISPNGVCVPTTHRTKSRLAPSLPGSFSNGFNTASLGIQSTNASVSKLNIYPNPSSGLITLTYVLNSGGNVRTTIVNELGQIVYDNTAQKGNGNITEQLNLGSLASGIYSLRLQTDNSIMVRKLVIMEN